MRDLVKKLSSVGNQTSYESWIQPSPQVWPLDPCQQHQELPIGFSCKYQDSLTEVLTMRTGESSLARQLSENCFMQEMNSRNPDYTAKVSAS